MTLSNVTILVNYVIVFLKKFNFYFQEEIKEFLLALALCHTVQADEARPTESENDQSDGVPLTPTTTKVYTYQVNLLDQLYFWV